MKKVIFENGLRAFLATFCFLVLGAVAVSAQGKLVSVAVVPGVTNPPVTTSPVYDVPQGTFVNSAQAILKLDDAMVQLKTDMQSTQGQGDPTFDALLVQYRYYRAIHDHLDAGATVPNAIAAGLWIFLESAQMSSVPQSTQQSLKNQAIALLQ